MIYLATLFWLCILGCLVNEIIVAVRQWRSKRSWYIACDPKPDSRSSIEITRNIGKGRFQ
jgi:hypothetical protein